MSNVTFVRNDRACEEVGLSRPHLNKLIRWGKFPQSFKVGARAVAVLRSDLEEWKKARIAGREWTPVERG